MSLDAIRHSSLVSPNLEDEPQNDKEANGWNQLHLSTDRNFSK